MTGKLNPEFKMQPKMNPIVRTASESLLQGVNWGGALVVLFSLAIALPLGAIAALGSLRIDVVLAGGLIGVMLLALPSSLFVLMLVLLSFFVVGQVFYFGGIGQVVWVPYGIGLILYAKIAAHSLHLSKHRSSARIDPVIFFSVAFLISIAISAAVNKSSFIQVIAGGKNLFGLWGLLFVIAAGLVEIKTIHKIWRFLFFAFAIQLPLALYQLLVIAPKRTRFGVTSGVEWDSVVGGFGGDPSGGGASGSMALFVCIIALYSIALARRGLLAMHWLILVVGVMFVCVALAEVKVVVVLVPIGLAVLFWSWVRERPFLAVGASVLGITFALAVLYSYQFIHYRAPSKHVDSPTEVIEKAFSYSLDPRHINIQSREMGRAAAVVHWWNENGTNDVFHTVFGHGPGASRGRSNFAIGEAAQRYPFLIDRSAATQILWDVGAFGFLVFIAVLYFGFMRAFQSSRSAGVLPRDAAILEASAAGLAMMAITIFYGRDLLEVPAMSVLLMFLLGCAVFLGKQAPQHAVIKNTISKLSSAARTQ